jgi:predicted esterase
VEHASGTLVSAGARIASGLTALVMASAACSTTKAPEAKLTTRDPAPSDAAENTPSNLPNDEAERTVKTETDASEGALAPLAADADLIRLPVAGYRDAVVSVPVGATVPRPVVIALHGNFDRPEWQCEVWRGITEGKAFVVCPRGIPRPDAPRSLDRWTYGKGTDVRGEVTAALSALGKRFENYVASGPVLYAGFSLGAIHGVGIVAEDGQRYPRAVLVEGGHDGWTPARAKSYAAAGGKRVLFACGQRGCKAGAARAEKNLRREGIETQIVFGGEVGHTYDGPVATEIGRAWTWLVGGDPRFADRETVRETAVGR